MATALYLENFLESIETLPQEMQRNFSVMRDLDQRTQDLIREIETTSQEFKKNVHTLGREDRKRKLTKISESYQKAREYSDNKVQIAVQMYEMVDKYIRKLDTDLSRFEQELQLKDTTSAHPSISSASDMPGALQPAREQVGSGDPIPSKKRKLPSSSGPDEPGSSGLKVPPVASSETSAVAGTDVLDMPVDPNEPTYCLCHQVSFGEMIGCDNPDCPIEWFHFQCVGLTSKPKGKWYCSRCSQEREKNKKKH
ncbi:hypothetical protein EMCRGX_G026403 [Ephydatia muelleri]|eukprot:Em0014g601a